MAVTYAEEHYDMDQKLVSFQFAPRSHAPPAIFFSRFVMATGFPTEVFHVVHDFVSSVQYTINDVTGNCTVEPIAKKVFESEAVDTSNDLKPVPIHHLGPNKIMINTKFAGGLGGPSRLSQHVHSSHIRLKHAQELLEIDPDKFVYAGEVNN